MYVYVYVYIYICICICKCICVNIFKIIAAVSLFNIPSAKSKWNEASGGVGCDHSQTTQMIPFGWLPSGHLLHC